MLVGAHESISGGFHLSIERAVEDACETVQIFTGPPARWKVPAVEPEAAAQFRQAALMAGIGPVVVHGAYLINPAGPDPDMWSRSLNALREEYERSASLGADFLVLHPGSHRGTSPGEGVRRAAEMVQAVLEDDSRGPVILLENTAGSGSAIGATFEELAAVRNLVKEKDRVLYCFDTAHAFAAGYDLRDAGSVEETIRRIDDEAGIENVRVVHLNDSKRELGSRIDRHERIGMGSIGMNGFTQIMRRAEFASVPGILETDPLPDREGRYRPQVELLRRMRGDAR